MLPEKILSNAVNSILPFSTTINKKIEFEKSKIDKLH